MVWCGRLSAALFLSKELLIIGGRSQFYSPQHAHHGRVCVPVIAVVNPWPSESKSWLQTRREAVMGHRALAMAIEGALRHRAHILHIGEPGEGAQLARWTVRRAAAAVRWTS